MVPVGTPRPPPIERISVRGWVMLPRTRWSRTFPLRLPFALVLLALVFGPSHAGLGIGVPVPLDPARGPAALVQDQVAAASNGTVTLFVWRDTRYGTSDVFAARV